MNIKLEQQILDLLHQFDDAELDQILHYIQQKQSATTQQTNFIEPLGSPNGIDDI
ncbi:MAG: hypothetical protein ACKOUU_08835 [Acinetobacter tjernbergiae]